MPRPIPQYNWGLVNSPQLSGEKHSHRMKAKGRAKGYKSDSIPSSFRKTDRMCERDVHYGSHKQIEHQIRDEMLRLGL